MNIKNIQFRSILFLLVIIIVFILLKRIKCKDHVKIHNKEIKSTEDKKQTFKYDQNDTLKQQNKDLKFIEYTNRIEDTVEPVLSDEEWSYIENNIKGVSKRQALDLFKRFDTRLPFLETSMGLSKDIVSNITQQEVGSSIYNLYKDLRKQVMMIFIEDSSRASFFYHTNIISTFSNFDNFFALTPERLLYSPDSPVFTKIIMYTYFIVIYEIRKFVGENPDAFLGYEQYCIGDDYTIENILTNLMNTFYIASEFKKQVVEGKSYLISFRDLHIKICGFDDIPNGGPGGVKEILGDIKKESYLEVVNNIYIQCGNVVIMPLNFVDRVINCILLSLYPR
ncbi:hypothetical protein NGRA_1392 [Nosema granulosis]|uniref:Uncharacterized protein n=1 Tax=Nosema granulosis TaxID=83296 RepID=A0A9P6KYN3_9MICR|nr:hypothetical protein NGRA_1392 [Nosema granulosis]